MRHGQVKGQRHDDRKSGEGDQDRKEGKNRCFRNKGEEELLHLFICRLQDNPQTTPTLTKSTHGLTYIYNITFIYINITIC